MSGFSSISELVDSFESGKTWISTFRKQVPSSATISGQWYDYSYASGNPIPNYYAASPLVAETLEAGKGIILPSISSGEKMFLHRLTVMSAASGATIATSQNQACYLLDYLLYYPFVDMDAAGEDQVMDNTTTLPRYSNGVGVQIMVVAQSVTIGGGRFTISFIDSDDNPQTTTSIFCAVAQPPGAIVSAVLATGGLTPFVPLPAGVKGVKQITSVNFSVANGGLCSAVLVRPLQTFHIYEECRQSTGTIESYGDAAEVECCSLRGGIVEIKNGAFLGVIGQGSAGSLASSVLVGTLETVWN